MKEGLDITEAFEHFCQYRRGCRVYRYNSCYWCFCGLFSLKFQADMGSLLTFMFIINMVCAMTTLPALAVVLDKLFPRKRTNS